MSKKYILDVDAVLARRHDNGADYWATADGRLGVGEPFSTLTSLLILHELKVPRTHEAIRGALQLIRGARRDDGRYRLAPSGTLYPCYTAAAARVLCRFGQARERGLQQTLVHLLETQHDDGGWRCKKFSYGWGPETVFSNPGVTLSVLDVFRFTEHVKKNPCLDRAVESLLDHWVVRRPMGPCHFGIGTLFMQVEYPFLRYNLFYYVYVLSFYDRAKEDQRLPGGAPGSPIQARCAKPSSSRAPEPQARRPVVLRWWAPIRVGDSPLPRDREELELGEVKHGSIRLAPPSNGMQLTALRAAADAEDVRRRDVWLRSV